MCYLCSIIFSVYYFMIALLLPNQLIQRPNNFFFLSTTISPKSE